MFICNVKEILFKHKLVQKLGLHLSLIPRVEAGKNTSTVTPASRKRRCKGNRISLRWDSANRPNEDLFLYKPLHVIQNHSKLAYSI
jgi:hypothetical protein